MKTILFLDAQATIIPCINYAKKCGYRVITCDSIPSREGHKYSDKSYNVSTYDTDKLIELAKKENVDGVVFFASSHGLYGACSVIEKLHLSGITEFINNVFSNKGHFREFLKKRGLNYPKYQIVNSANDNILLNDYPAIVKPVDSAGGNTGVSKVYNKSQVASAIEYALKESYSKQVLIEQFIESDIQINGDCLINDGNIDIIFIGKHLFSSKESIIPYATIFGPNIIDEEAYISVKKELQSIVRNIDLKNGIINIEIRIDKNNNKPYTIEINPRHSGNKLYKLMNIEYNLSFEEIAVDNSLGIPFNKKIDARNGYYAYCILYSRSSGVLKDIKISPLLSDKIIEKFDYKKMNDSVCGFKTLRDRISLLLLSFKDKEEMEKIICNIENYYTVELY